MRLLGTIAVVAMSSSVAFAAPQGAFSNPLVNDVAKRVVSDYRTGGMALVSASAKECYRKAYKHAPDKTIIGRCVLYDISGHHLDNEWRDETVLQGNADPGATTEFFSDEQFSGRMTRLYTEYFRSDDAFQRFLADAPHRVEVRVAYLLNQPTPDPWAKYRKDPLAKYDRPPSAHSRMRSTAQPAQDFDFSKLPDPFDEPENSAQR